jgi:hypothetical protein
MRGAAHGQQKHDVASPETAPNTRRVAAIPEHTVRPLPWSSACAVQWGNRIHQREGSGCSAAAIHAHATSPTRFRFRRFCYAL